MGLRHKSPPRGLDDYSTAGCGGSLFHRSLKVIPSAVPEIMPGEQSLDPFGADLLVATFEALHFVLSDRSHIPAYGEKGQPQYKGKAQHQPELNGEKPARHRQTYSPIRRQYG